jgi:hypothetical protein
MLTNSLGFVEIRTPPTTRPCNSKTDYHAGIPKRNGLPPTAIGGRPLAIGSSPP